jgi:hypothetical protein
VALSKHEEFRRAVRDLGIVAQADLAVLWRSVRDARDAKEALMDLLPDLVETYSLAAGSLAADYYDEVREQVAAKGRFTAIVPEPGETDTRSLVAWALDNAADGAGFRTLIEGGFQKRIANGARNVVTTSAISDPAADGWMRIGTGECDFCAMLVARGAVYREASVDFAAHDRDKCQAAPSFDAEQTRDVKQEFVYSARRKVDGKGNVEPIAPADKARVSDWIAANL